MDCSKIEIVLFQPAVIGVSQIIFTLIAWVVTHFVTLLISSHFCDKL